MDIEQRGLGVLAKVIEPVLSPARLERRAYIIEAATALIGATTPTSFDPAHSELCAADVVMVAGSPWLKDGLERDFSKDESGYRKIGGGANTPQVAYFFRSTANLVHYLKRQGFYTPRGGSPVVAAGMVCFFDWEDRGRFNFAPDRSGIITQVIDNQITKVVFAMPTGEGRTCFCVKEIALKQGDLIDRALIGYSDLP